MVTMWSSISIILSLSITINAASLLDFPMEIPNDHLIFHSLVTHVSTSQQWQMVESLAGVSQVHGKIQVTMADTHKFEIFYHSDRDDHRLLLNDDSCSLVSYESGRWSTLLPGVEQSLVNMIIMLGPSLIYRFDTFTFEWDEERDNYKDEDEIRGVQVISYSTQIGSTLKIIVYFKSDLDLEVGLRNPLRMVFEEGKSGSAIKTEKVILDVYSIKSADTNLDEVVEVTPGYGCNIYFQPGRVFPEVSGTQIHLVATDTHHYNDEDTTAQVERVEIFADTEMNYLRVDRRLFGSPYEETVYDTDLGIGYTFMQKNGNCRLTPLTTKTPGISGKGSFDLKQLLMVQGTVKYVGNIFLPNKWPFLVDYWESTLYNVQLEGNHFDKVVTTYYFALKTDEHNYVKQEAHSIPTSIMRKAKGKWPTGLSYTFNQRREIHDFHDSITEDQYKSAFTISECVNDLDLKVTLTLLIDPQDANGLKFGEKNVHKLRESLRKLITEEISLSPLRIVGVDISFTEERIRAFLSIIETPRLENSLESYDTPVDTEVLTTSGLGYHIGNAEECLKFLAANTELKSAVYCGSRSLCFGVKDPDLITEATKRGTIEVCRVFVIPFGNLNHLKKQIPLADIDSAFQNKIVGTTFELRSDDTGTHTYKIQGMDDISMNSERVSERQAFTSVKEGAKLNVNQPVGIVKSVDVTSYGDCYRSCEQSKQLDCSIFSYCYNETSDSHECLVSQGLNMTEDHKNGDGIIDDRDCTIEKRNLLFDYLKLPPQTGMDWMGTTTGSTMSIEDCAVKCTQSTDCASFKYCNSLAVCYLPSGTGNHQTNQPIDQATNSSLCDYYLQKASNRFKVTGSKIVTDVIQTVTDLDLDQCAAKCFNRWVDEESTSECQSFNFCVKDQSTLCSISALTIQSEGVTLSDSTNCINYEITKPNRLQNEQQQETVSAHKSSITATMLMVMVGLAFGIGSPFAYKKLKQKLIDYGMPMQRLS